METEYDDRVEQFHKLQSGGYILKYENDEGRDDDKTSEIHRMLSHLCAIILSNSKRILNHFIIIIIIIITGTKTSSVYYMDTFSL